MLNSTQINSNIEQTFAAFNSFIDWVRQSVTNEPVEQGILSIISAIDKPPSPSAEAISDFHANLSGRTVDKRKEFRKKIISCSLGKIIEVAKKYLSAKLRRAIVSSRKFESELQAMDFHIRNL